MLILGFVPALSGNLTQIFRPLFILVCLLFPARRYVLRSEKWQFVLLLYWLFILLLNPITASSVKYYLALVLFAIFSVLASSRVWGKREIKFLLNTAVASALILSVILIYSNNGLINAGSEMRVSFLSHTCNRNTVAFGCVQGVLCAAERRRRRLGKGSALCARTLNERRRRKAALRRIRHGGADDRNLSAINARPSTRGLHARFSYDK